MAEPVTDKPTGSADCSDSDDSSETQTPIINALSRSDRLRRVMKMKSKWRSTDRDGSPAARMRPLTCWYDQDSCATDDTLSDDNDALSDDDRSSGETNGDVVRKRAKLADDIRLEKETISSTSTYGDEKMDGNGEGVSNIDTSSIDTDDPSHVAVSSQDWTTMFIDIAWYVVYNTWWMLYQGYGYVYRYFTGSSASFDRGGHGGTGVDERANADQSPSNNRLYNICLELLTTEQDYVRRLDILVMAKEKTAKILQPAIAKEMFKDIEVIYQFHHDTLLPQLRERVRSWDKRRCIADIMVKCAPFLKLSTEYVKQFETATSLLESWEKKSSSFASFLREIAMNNSYGRLKIQAHMLEPVQRIPRYELLLRDYHRHLPEDSPDKADAEKALQLVAEAASHFENMMKRDSRIGQLMKIQRQLDGSVNIVKPNREFVKDGKIMKISIKTGKPTERYALLFSDILLLCSELKLYVRRYKVRDVIPVEQLQIYESGNQEGVNAFYIKSDDQVSELCMASGEEKTQWQNSLWKQIHECAKRKLRSQTSMRGSDSGCEVDRQDIGNVSPTLILHSGISKCMLCTAEFVSFKRKHHCNGCGIVVCGKCSSRTAYLPYSNCKAVRICDECFVVLCNATECKYENFPIKTNPLRKPNGHTVQEGWLQLSSDNSKTWKKRWLSLHDNNVLYSFRHSQDKSPVLTINVEDTFVDFAELTNKKFPALRLQTEDKSYLLYDETDGVLRSWNISFQTTDPQHHYPEDENVSYEEEEDKLQHENLI